MKKAMITVLVILVVFVSGIGFGVHTMMNHIYSRDGIVTEVNTETDEVIWVDGVGHWWVIEGTDDWMVNDGITVINFDMFTDNIEDDYTIEYRYSNR